MVLKSGPKERKTLMSCPVESKGLAFDSQRLAFAFSLSLCSVVEISFRRLHHHPQFASIAASLTGVAHLPSNPPRAAVFEGKTSREAVRTRQNHDNPGKAQSQSPPCVRRGRTPRGLPRKNPNRRCRLPRTCRSALKIQALNFLLVNTKQRNPFSVRSHTAHSNPGPAQKPAEVRSFTSFHHRGQHRLRACPFPLRAAS